MPPVATGTVVRTPEQALNSTRIVAGAMAVTPFLLLGMLFLVLSSASRSGNPKPEFSPVFYVIWVLALAAGASSLFVANFMGRRAARKWAEAGKKGEDIVAPAAAESSSKVLGLDVGPTQIVPQTLWSRFTGASIVGCVLAMTSALESYVVTIATKREYVMAAGMTVFLVFLILNFPRKRTWDLWAESAGLTLPWSSANREVEL